MAEGEVAEEEKVERVESTRWQVTYRRQELQEKVMQGNGKAQAVASRPDTGSPLQRLVNAATPFVAAKVLAGRPNRLQMRRCQQRGFFERLRAHEHLQASAEPLSKDCPTLCRVGETANTPK